MTNTVGASELFEHEVIRTMSALPRAALLSSVAAETRAGHAPAHLRGIRALETLAPSPLTAAEVARILEVNRSTALRILTDLQAAGYVARDPKTKRYSTVVARLWGLLADNQEYTDWRDLVDPILSGLRDEFGEAACVAVPANGVMVYLAFFPSRHPIALRERLGATRPMHCSAIGKAYLSALSPQELDIELGRIAYAEGTARAAKGPLELRSLLEEARRDGFALDRGETADGAVCVAVPARIGGILVGAGGLQGPAMRLPEERLREIGERLVEAFGRISGAG